MERTKVVVLGHELDPRRDALVHRLVATGIPLFARQFEAGNELRRAEEMCCGDPEIDQVWVLTGAHGEMNLRHFADYQYPDVDIEMLARMARAPVDRSLLLIKPLWFKEGRLRSHLGFVIRFFRQERFMVYETEEALIAALVARHPPVVASV